MTKSEHAHEHNPTAQQDISALEQHQRRLLYVGGAFLSLIILLILGASIRLSIDDYKSDQLDDFRKAKLLLDPIFIQRDTSYVRSLNMFEYAWQNRTAELIAKGEKEVQAFTANGNEVVIRESPQSMPWLLLGTDMASWPPEKLDRYLGLAYELSSIGSTSMNQRGRRLDTTTYFYDPSATLFAFSSIDPGNLQQIEGNADRASLFSKLVSPDIDFHKMQEIHKLSRGNPALAFYGSNMPRVMSSHGRNPMSGKPAITATLVAMDGDTPIGVFLNYESIDPYIERLRQSSQNELTVISQDGQLVFGSGTEASSQAIADAFRPLMVLKSTDAGIESYQKGGRFFLAGNVEGTSWTLVRTYGWPDVIAGESKPIMVEIGLAGLLLLGLWLLLIRQDRSVFAPVLARAKQVYHSEALNRTMIETSPVGLCVIAINDAAPLLQNDLVRHYAIEVPDPDSSFYRRLCQDYTHATHSLNGRAEAREFSLALTDEQAQTARHLLVAAIPIVYQDQDALFCVLRDVTARIELEENLRQARHDSEQAKLAAESASRAKTSFVATMSHEIRTPLNGILGHLELLGRSHLEPSQRERLDRIRLSADALLGIISDVLDFSRIEAGQLDIDPVPFELRPLIEQTALLYAPTAQRKGIKLYYGVEPGLASGYVADVHRIRQVLNNLVSNAVKFTESGRIILRVKRGVDEAGEAVRLCFEVIDSGIGMTEQQRQQVFQPFSQADASISRRFGGSGLGLTLCQQISELMDGHIEVQSTPSVGSVFSFEVPVVVDEHAQLPDPMPLAKRRVALLSAASEWRAEIAPLLTSWGADVMVAAQPAELDPDWVSEADAMVIFGAWRAWTDDEEEGLTVLARCLIKATVDGPLLPQWHEGARHISCYSSAALQAALLDAEPERGASYADEGEGQAVSDAQARHGKVLLVDDNPVNRELIQQQLETLGYTVDAAEDGVAALRVWHEDRYEIVLTDINMPNMNGYELTEQLRARGVRVPILAVTATALASEKVRCKQAGINDLLLKPLSLERLGDALTHHLTPASPPSAATVKVAWAGKYPEKVCRVFVESGTRDLDAILDATHKRDRETLLARIHSLKGALLMLGEQDVATQCAALERLIDKRDIHAAMPGIEKLESAMRELLQRYASVC